MESSAHASDRIRIEELEVFARVGVTESERARPQRLTLNLTVWLSAPFEALEDDITRTANYSGISVATREFVREPAFNLIETLAARLAAHLLQEFPIARVEIEMRKFVLPEAKYVAVEITRDAAAK